MAATQALNGVPLEAANNGVNAQVEDQAPSAAATAAMSGVKHAAPPNEPIPAAVPSQQQQQYQHQHQQQQQRQQQQQPPPFPATSSTPRPRDIKLIELLFTSCGITAYEPRVPLLLLDFAYRHTSSILNDALHLSADPYTTHAGARPSGIAGLAGPTVANTGDAVVSANAVRLAIGARLNFQFRGGAGAGGISKECMQDIAKERNRIALPKVPPNEWGVRLPSERFVLSGASWGLRDEWAEMGSMDLDDDGDDNDGESGENGENGENGDIRDAPAQPAMMQDHDMGGMDSQRSKTHSDDEEADGDNDIEPGNMEDVFGDDIDGNEKENDFPNSEQMENGQMDGDRIIDAQMRED